MENPCEWPLKCPRHVPMKTRSERLSISLEVKRSTLCCFSCLSSQTSTKTTRYSGSDLTTTKQQWPCGKSYFFGMWFWQDVIAFRLTPPLLERSQCGYIVAILCIQTENTFAAVDPFFFLFHFIFFTYLCMLMNRKGSFFFAYQNVEETWILYSCTIL